MAAREARAQVLQTILRRYHTGDLLTCCIIATAMTLKRRQGRGLPVADAPDEGGQCSGSGKSSKPPHGCAAISL
jgi:hypothetical protein